MSDQRKDLIFPTPLGDVVKAWREARGLTVTELANRAGEPISKGYISEVENNKIRKPNDEYLIRIKAAEFGIPVITSLELAKALIKALTRPRGHRKPLNKAPKPADTLGEPRQAFSPIPRAT